MGIESRMMRFCKALLIASVATALLSPAAFAAPSDGKQVKRTKLTVHPNQRWRGYGFLPGYRPSLAETQGIPIMGRQPRRREMRYWDFNGNVRYGWGHPGFYRGRYNGGSFGPCWTYTPIGMMPNCGQ